VISGLSVDPVAVKNGWDVALWFDVLTLPGTDYSDDFYAEMEAWFFDAFKAPLGQVMPEWSKGWAYTAPNGAWTNQDVIEDVREFFTTGRDANDNWDWEVATLAKYDAKNIFQSPLTVNVFVNSKT
jgi:hypothetical protein